MPSLAALTSLVLLASSNLVVAQISSPDCSLLWNWSFNTLGQNACTVAAYLMSTCNNGAFTINALPLGSSYTGPTAADGTNLCKCNTVAYNLLSACDACQGAIWIPWSEYIINCTSTLPPSTFPNAVPSGTRVPHWALMDDTAEGLWDATTAMSVGDSPEVMPGSFISGTSSATTAVGAGSGHSTTAVAAATKAGSPSSATSLASQSGSSSKSSSNTAAIAGGVAGGVVALAAIAAILFYFLRRRTPPQAPSAAFVVDPAVPAQPPVSHMVQVASPALPSDDGSTYAPGTPVSPMKLYDPNDPSTYPGYQRVATTDVNVNVPATPYEPSVNSNSLGGNTMNTLGGNTMSTMGGNTLNGNSLANMQTAHPGGYHGLPTV